MQGKGFDVPIILRRVELKRAAVEPPRLPVLIKRMPQQMPAAHLVVKLEQHRGPVVFHGDSPPETDAHPGASGPSGRNALDSSKEFHARARRWHAGGQTGPLVT